MYISIRNGFIGAAITALTLPILISAATRFVPADFPTIQSAINAAVAGDSILVDPGTYQENLDFLQRHLYLSSTAGAQYTTISSAKDSTAVIRIGDAYRGESTVNGFTITGSRNAPGIITYYSYTTISNCDIHDCRTNVIGGGIYVENQKDVTIVNNVIHDNVATTNGGAIYISTTRLASVTHNKIYNNTAGQGSAIGTRYLPNYGPLVFAYNEIYRNKAINPESEHYALYLSTYGDKVFNNTIVLNSGGMSARWTGGDSIHSNIIAFNAASGFVASATTAAKYNCIFGNGQSDSLAYMYGLYDNPLLKDTLHNDFSLLFESVCINAGNPDSAYNDSDGTRADIGVRPYHQTFPIGQGLYVGDERMDRVVNHIPEFSWSYFDTSGMYQTGFTIQVGRYNNPFRDLLWDYSNDNSQDSSSVYAGGNLVDGEKYYVRLRLQNALGEGDWRYSYFQMNRIPDVPVPISPTESISAALDGVQLRVDTVYSVEHDTISYDFELYSDNDLQDLVFSQYGSALNQTEMIDGLMDGTRYWWRARTYDQREHSNWCSPATFVTRPNTVINVPADFATIQEALNVASQGDTILLDAGIYTGPGNRDLLTSGRAVVIKGLWGAQNTVIDCEGSRYVPHRAILVDLPIDTTLVVEGITFRNGYYEEGGGAIYCENYPIRVSNCEFTNNTGRYGGALMLANSQAVVENCNFISNVGLAGGAIYGLALGSTVSNCQFFNHSGGVGSAVLDAQGAIFENCVFRDNTASSSYMGTAVLCCMKGSEITGCKFIANTTNSVGGVCWGGKLYDHCLFMDNDGPSSAIMFYVSAGQVKNSTFFANETAIRIVGGYADVSGCLIAFNRGYSIDCITYWNDPMPPEPADVDLSYSDIFGNGFDYADTCLWEYESNNGNLSCDPLFCDTTSEDLALDGSSLCVGATETGENIGGLIVACGSTGDEEREPQIPGDFSLSQNYPNPFNPSTNIQFELPTTCKVTITIYNLLGQRVASLADREYPMGSHSVTWDGHVSNGGRAATGIYFYRIETDSFVQTKKMLLIR